MKTKYVCRVEVIKDMWLVRVDRASISPCGYRCILYSLFLLLLQCLYFIWHPGALSRQCTRAVWRQSGLLPEMRSVMVVVSSSYRIGELTCQTRKSETESTIQACRKEAGWFGGMPFTKRLRAAARTLWSNENEKERRWRRELLGRPVPAVICPVPFAWTIQMASFL